jgi:hypothetical protein
VQNTFYFRGISKWKMYLPEFQRSKEEELLMVDEEDDPRGITDPQSAVWDKEYTPNDEDIEDEEWFPAALLPPVVWKIERVIRRSVRTKRKYWKRPRRVPGTRKGNFQP